MNWVPKEGKLVQNDKGNPLEVYGESKGKHQCFMSHKLENFYSIMAEQRKTALWERGNVVNLEGWLVYPGFPKWAYGMMPFNWAHEFCSWPGTQALGINLWCGQESQHQSASLMLSLHLCSLPVVGFELIFRKLASSSTKMCIREQQLFTVFELKNLTLEITFAWSLRLSISTCRKGSMNNNCHFRDAPLQLFICFCVFPDVHLIGSDTKNQIAGFQWQRQVCTSL